MAAKQSACWDAGVEPQEVIALLASVAGWCGQLQEAGVICSPSCAWDMEKEDSLRGSCMHHMQLMIQGTTSLMKIMLI